MPLYTCSVLGIWLFQLLMPFSKHSGTGPKLVCSRDAHEQSRGLACSVFLLLRMTFASLLKQIVRTSNRYAGCC